MTDKLALADRVEALSGPDAEVDAIIWYRLVEKPEHGDKLDKDIQGRWPHYTASFDAAMTLLPPNHMWAAGSCNEDDNPWACVTNSDGEDFTSTGATPALVLLAAILRARVEGGA